MADLNPLIRVRRHALEQKQKLLAELYKQAEDYELQKTALLAQLEEEREKTEKMGAEMMPYFMPYAESVKQRVADIDEAVEKLNTRIDIAREDMRTAFAEVKKLEITQEKREAEEREEREKKESDELDEIALDTYRRNQIEEAE